MNIRPATVADADFLKKMLYEAATWNPDWPREQVIEALSSGFGNGIGSGTMMTLGADLAPRQSVGEFLGIWNLIGDFGSSAGPLAIGVVAGSLSLVPAIFVIAGVGAAGSAILGWLVPETLSARRAST